MQEVVLRFSENCDFNEARGIQKCILDSYEQDFSKHAPLEIVPKIRMVWNSIPSHPPLKAYEDLKTFKLFVLDVGLLGCMTGLRQQVLLDGDNLFKEFKGALAEQYVLQQLKTIPKYLIYYYTNDRGSCEVDFLLDNGEQVIPIEVKAEINLKAKSLKTYCEKYKPTKAIRTSLADYKEQDRLDNVPLYMLIDYLENGIF